MPRLTPEERLKVKVLNDLGISFPKIADELKITMNTVRKWLRRKKLDKNDIHDNARRRKHKLSKTTEKKIVEEVLNEKSTSLQKIASRHNVSKTTIWRIIKNYDKNDPIIPYKMKKSVFK